MRITSEHLLNAPSAALAQPQPGVSGRVFSLEQGNDRIDGSMPVWKKATTPQDQVQAALASALAERLKRARNRVFDQDVEDARIMNPPPLLPPSQSEKTAAGWQKWSERKAAEARSETQPMESNDEQLW